MVALGLLIATAALPLLAQSADQELQVTAAPEPIVPGNNLVYTIVVTNHGPDPAVNGGVNGSLASQLGAPSFNAPPGWNCIGGQFFTCNTPSFAVGSATITVTAQVASSLLAFDDGSFSSLFTPSGTTPDPNSANNNKTVTTNYVTPDCDIAVTATDSPDPVMVNNNLTYTIHVTNGGPDPALAANLGVVYNGGTYTYVSRVVPAGWTCGAATVGAPPSFNCTNPSLAAGADDVFTLVVKADPATQGPFNHPNVPQNFVVSSSTHDTNNGNNVFTATTTYDVPDADLEVTASDSPDPVYPNGNVTYTVTVTNHGPDATTGAVVSILNNNFRFQSVTAPAGWTCNAPPVGNYAGFNCTAATFANGATATITYVLKADPALLSIFPTNVQTIFTVSNDWYDGNQSNNVASLTTQYLPVQSDLSVTANGAPSTVPVGANVTFTGTISNAGPDAGPNTHFTVLLQSSLLFQSITPPPGFSCTTPAVGVTGLIDCTNASFAINSPQPFTIVVQVSPALLNTPGTTIDQAFTMGCDASDPQASNNVAHVITTYTTPHANLAITNADTPDPVTTGATITYTQVLTNNGPDAAANVVVVESIGGGVTFQSLAVPAGFNCTTPAVDGTGSIQCTIASLANGATATFTVVVKVTAAAGTITNTVSTSSDNYDPVSSNNSATATTTISAALSADLGITKSTTATSAAVGTTFTYTIAVHNAGPDGASSVVMTDTLPASLLFQSISAPGGFSCTTPGVGTTGTITCNGATLANGATATFTLTVKVAPGATGSINNSASVSSATSDPVGGNASGAAAAVIAAAASADVAITKTTAATAAATGSTLTYLITVTNNGPSTATNVTVADDLPTGLQFLSATPSQGNCVQGDPISCSLGTLATGASATISVQAQVIATSGTISNTATVTASEPDPVPANGSATTTPIPVTTQVPALGTWALLALALMLGVAAVVRMR